MFQVDRHYMADAASLAKFLGLRAGEYVSRVEETNGAEASRQVWHILTSQKVNSDDED